MSAQQKDLSILFVHNPPFNGFSAVFRDVILLVASEIDTVAHFRCRGIVIGIGPGLSPDLIVIVALLYRSQLSAGGIKGDPVLPGHGKLAIPIRFPQHPAGTVTAELFHFHIPVIHIHVDVFQDAVKGVVVKYSFSGFFPDLTDQDACSVVFIADIAGIDTCLIHVPALQHLGI